MNIDLSHLPANFTIKQFRTQFNLSIQRVAKITGLSVAEAMRIDHQIVTFNMLAQLIDGLGLHMTILISPVPMPKGTIVI